MRQKDPTSGYVSAATGSLFGYTVAGLAAAFLLGPPLGASPWLIITFDQDGVLELAGVTVVFALAIAIFVGAPLGCWLWLRRGRHRRAGITAGLVVPLLLALGWVAAAVVPAAPDDPVLLPFSSLLAAFVAGLLARAPGSPRWRPGRPNAGLSDPSSPSVQERAAFPLRKRLRFPPVRSVAFSCFAP